MYKSIAYYANLQTLGDEPPYTKLDKRKCVYYGSINSLSAAQKACSRDSHCSAVYDSGCDGNFWYLCRAGVAFRIDPSGCIYQKPEGISTIVLNDGHLRNARNVIL